MRGDERKWEEMRWLCHTSKYYQAIKELCWITAFMKSPSSIGVRAEVIPSSPACTSLINPDDRISIWWRYKPKNKSNYFSSDHVPEVKLGHKKSAKTVLPFVQLSKHLLELDFGTYHDNILVMIITLSLFLQWCVKRIVRFWDTARTRHGEKKEYSFIIIELNKQSHNREHSCNAINETVTVHSKSDTLR